MTNETFFWYCSGIVTAYSTLVLINGTQWFIDKLHEWRNERAIRRILERKDEPPYAI